MPIEKGESASAAEAASKTLEELQANVLAKAAEIRSALEDEAKKRQEAADLEDFKRQLRETAEASKAARTYVVKPGDTLSAIAQSQLGDAGKWPAIFEANRDKLSDPNLIRAGQELLIP